MTTNQAPRFSPGPFVYNGRVACGVLPAMAVMIGFGGTVVAAIGLLGAISSYMLDAFRHKEGALAVVWVTLAVTNLSLISASSSISEGSRPLLLSLCMLGTCSAVLCQAGCWATLQFRWVQMQYPPVVLALERLAVSGCVTCCGPMIAWGLVAGVGASSTPFYLAFLMSGYYLFCGTPLPSSFHLKDTSRGGASSQDWDPSMYSVQGRFEAACMACLTSVLPVGVYAALHRNVLWEPNHFWSLLLLGALPSLTVFSAPYGLWWLPIRKQQSNRLRYFCALVALAVLVAGIEGRVVFSSFRQYILIQPPWDWLAASLAIYGHGAAVLLHFSGALHQPAVHAAVLAGLLVSCLAACLAVGLPMYVIPGPIISAAGLGFYYRTRSMREYILFLAGAGIAGVWFILHHFWFLTISWPPGWAVQDVCKMLFLYTGPTLVLPGALLANTAGLVSALALVCHAALLLVVEIALVTGNEQFDDMYPAYATVATSAVGMLAVSHLADRREDIPAWSTWISLVLYGAKLSLLVLPDSSQAIYVASLVAAASAPMVLHPAKNTMGRLQKVPLGAGVIYVTLICMASWLCRHALFTALAGVAGERLGEGVAIGFLLLMTAVALLPLFTTHYRRASLPRVGILLLMSSGALLVAMQPPLPQAILCHLSTRPSRWMCLSLFLPSDAVVHEVDDVAIYGSGVGRREHWASWLLVLACLAGVAAGGQQRSPRATGLMQRVLLALVSGGAVGGYIALELFSRQTSLQLLIIGTCLLVSSAVVLLSFPLRTTPTFVPLLLLAWAVLLPAALIMEHEAPLPETAVLRLYPDSSGAVDEEQRNFRFASLLATYAVQSAVLAFCVKMKLSSRGGLESGDHGDHRSVKSKANASTAFGIGFPTPSGFSGFLGTCLPQSGISLSAQARASTRTKSGSDPRLNLEGLGWLPTVGNLIALLSFALSIFLEATWFDGGEMMVLPLSSLLLLLHQDPVLLPTLSEQRRYAPPFLALIFYLGFISTRCIISGDISATGIATSQALAREIICLALPLPCLALFQGYLWNSRSRSATMLLVSAPLNLLAIAVTNLSSIRLLSAIGVLAAVYQWFAMSRSHKTGLRML